ncbi:MAG: copper resistance CopC/CopD family protein [Acidimicrobiia bacterium]
MPRSRLSRSVGALTLAVAIVILAASPAYAHAVFEGSNPADGTIYPVSAPPTSLSMHWGESVGIKLGAVRMYDEHGHMVNIGAPEHPPGDGSTVVASLPRLAAGTYVVTWRVISADTHPVSGAFTFTVGTHQQNVSSLATKLLSSANGSKTVGVLYGTERFVLFSSLIALLGGAAFVALVWPTGRRSRRAARILWTAWAVAMGITLFGFAIEGIYAAGFPLREIFSATVLSDTLHERYGETAVARAAALLLALPLLGVLVSRKNDGDDRPVGSPPSWWLAGATIVSLATLATVTFASHGTTGRWTGLALPDDVLHLSAVSLWFGGLLMLTAAVLPDATTDTLIQVLPRYSNLAFVAVIAIFATGTFQALRQVGTLHALTSTTYGHLLIAKVTAFSVMIVVAAFSREIVDRTYEPQREALRTRAKLVTVAGPDGPTRDGTTEPEPHAFFDPADKVTIRRLRQTVRIEVGIAVVILIFTALLVDARPAYQVANGPQILTIKSPAAEPPVVWFNLVIQPAASGTNQIHVSTETPEGSIANPLQLTMELSNPKHDIGPLQVPLSRLGPGHYLAYAIEIPFSGTWQVSITALMTQIDEAIGTHNVYIR